MARYHSIMVMVSPLSLQRNGPDDSDEEAEGVADKGSEEASDTVSALKSSAMWSWPICLPPQGHS